MKRFRRSKKALSPVVASIILIAVTVAVSIAVAAWMGALTVGFMGTEQLQITSATLTAGPGTGQAVLAISNTGTASATINQIWLGNVQLTSPTYGIAYSMAGNSSTLAPNAQGTITLTNLTLASGNNYQFKLVTSKGNGYLYTQICP